MNLVSDIYYCLLCRRTMSKRIDVSCNRWRYKLFLDIYGPVGLSINTFVALLIILRSKDMSAYKWFLLIYQVSFSQMNF